MTNFYVRGCSLAIQAVVIILTVARYLSGEWRTVSLASLIFRDGCIEFGVISCKQSCISDGKLFLTALILQ